MIDHIGLAVSDMEVSRRFYEATLKPLGYEILMEVTEEMTGGKGAHLGMGRDGIHSFWIGTHQEPSKGVHLAFSSPDRAGVDAFYEAAIAAGAKENGPPGLRPEYHPNYYGAFVFDPEGNNIEAVCHREEA